MSIMSCRRLLILTLSRKDEVEGGFLDEDGQEGLDLARVCEDTTGDCKISFRFCVVVRQMETCETGRPPRVGAVDHTTARKRVSDRELL